MTPPRALLLDFHGVIAVADRTGPPPPDLVLPMLRDLIGDAVPVELIEADLLAAGAAVTSWNDAVARWYATPELTHEQFWGDFVAADWPAPARSAVLARATELTRAHSASGWPLRLRGGVADLLDLARDAAIPVAVVSNVADGDSFRSFVAGAGLADRFAVQIYSNEVGVRKPNPAMVYAATDHLGVPPADTWFVGDIPDRDILAARRAGVGVAILVRAGRDRIAGPRTTPDVVADSMVDVHRLLREALG